MSKIKEWLDETVKYPRWVILYFIATIFVLGIWRIISSIMRLVNGI